MNKAGHHGERGAGFRRKSMASISFRYIGFECWPTSEVGKSGEYVGPELKHHLGLEITIWESSAKW